MSAQIPDTSTPQIYWKACSKLAFFKIAGHVRAAIVVIINQPDMLIETEPRVAILPFRTAVSGILLMLVLH